MHRTHESCDTMMKVKELVVITDYEQDCKPDLNRIKQTASHYAMACGVVVRYIDCQGNTLFVIGKPEEQLHICSLAGNVLPGARPDGQSPICSNAHLYGCYQSERFGGCYIYFCPLGLTHWASPIMQDGVVIGALIGGPVNMVDPDDFLIEELVAKNGIHPDNIPALRREMIHVPLMPTERVNSLSELLLLAARSLSDDTYSVIDNNRRSVDLQSRLWDQINAIKTFSYTKEETASYPIDKEHKLLDLIEAGNKSGAQEILNEILGHIFFSSSGSIEVMRARVIELVVLLSRAAIRGGADVEQIFGLNFIFLNKISSFTNIDEIAYWLSGILTRFTDQVFNLANIKHADVIYRAVDYIRKNYMKKITLEDISAEVFLSPAYFSRVFKEETGDNYNIFVNKIRVEAARKLLLNEQIPLSDVSTLVGFDGQSYFSKVFKKLVGVSPGRFRESRGKIHSPITS